MRRPSTKRLAAGVVSLALIASIATIGFSSLSASGAVAMNRAQVTCNKQGQFNPGFSRRQIDLIVAHGQPVSAHNHDFTGYPYPNPLTDSKWAQSVSRQKPGGLIDPGYGPFSSNCKLYAYWPLQWFPVGKLNGVDTLPGTITNTYQAPQGSPVVYLPFGASLLSGNAMATQTDPHVRYTCGDANGAQGASIDGPGSDHPTDCTGVPGGVVTGEITFPNCWDGQGAVADANGVFTFDQPYGIGTSHFTYAGPDGKCAPGSIPCVPGKLIPQLVTMETWMDNRATLGGAPNPDFNKPLRNPLNADGTMALSFSSGSFATLHGDYINWNSDSLMHTIFDKCLNNGTPGSCPFGTPVGLHVLE